MSTTFRIGARVGIKSTGERGEVLSVSSMGNYRLRLDNGEERKVMGDNVTTCGHLQKRVSHKSIDPRYREVRELIAFYKSLYGVWPSDYQIDSWCGDGAHFLVPKPRII